VKQKKTQAIVLKRVAYGEADWIVTLFTRDEGRLSGIAKSARKSLKRFGGALEPGTFVSLHFRDQRGFGLASLLQATVERPVNGFLRSLEKFLSLTRVLELAETFLPERQAAPEKFDLMEKRLMRLSQAEPKLEESLEYDLHWLSMNGFKPHLSDCAVCACPPNGQGGWVFDFNQAGLLCSSCSSSEKGGRIKITPDLALFFCTWEKRSGELKKEVGQRAQHAISEYISHVIGRGLRSKIAII